MKGTLTVLTSNIPNIKVNQVFWFSEISDLYDVKQSKFKLLFKVTNDKGMIAFMRWDRDGLKVWHPSQRIMIKSL